MGIRHDGSFTEHTTGRASSTAISNPTNVTIRRCILSTFRPGPVSTIDVLRGGLRWLNTKLVGQNYSTPDLRAKVTGRARYAEDFRAEGMLFARLLLSRYPHARVRSIDTSAALAMPGVKAILTADEVPGPRTRSTTRARPSKPTRKVRRR